MGRLLIAGALIGLLGCSNPNSPTWTRDMGTIGIHQHAATPGVLISPDTVRAGVPFTVTVTTYGSSSCTRPDESDVTTFGFLIEVIPFDQRLTRGVCTDDLRAFPRAVTVTFPQPGRGLLRVRGRSLFGGTEVVERNVTVIR